MRIEHHAKINICLYVTGQRQDGYHLLETVMQEVGLADVLTLEKATENRLECNHPAVPLGNENLIWKAYHQLAGDYSLTPVHCTLEKNIPVAAGVGGGSANAAAMLEGLNALFELGLSKEELIAYATPLGADVPYFLIGGTVYATGIGNELHTLPSYAGKWVVLANDGTPISSKEVYVKGPTQTQPQMDVLFDELEKQQTALTVHNDLLAPVLALYPHMEQVIADVKSTGADTALLSGSGATVFGIYDNEQRAKDAAKQLEKYPFVYVTQTL